MTQGPTFGPVADAELGGGGPWTRTGQQPGPAGTSVDVYSSPTGAQLRVLAAPAGSQAAVELVSAADRAQPLTTANVTPVRARGVGADGSVWVALDDYRLPSVADLTRAGQRFDPEAAYRAADTVLGVLDATQTAGVHGVAVTPDTVHVAAGGAPVVDVLSVVSDPARGTVSYYPDGNTGPAVVPGQTAAVGGILYALLTGRPGAVGSPPPSAVVPGLDPRLDAVPARALSADPSAHYQTLSQMRADVAATLATAATASVTVTAPVAATTAVMAPAVTAPAEPAVTATPRKSGRGWVVVAVVALLALVGVGIWWLVSQGQKVAVPDVVGQSQSAAQQSLTAAGFTVTVTTVTSDRAVGTVLTQDPTPGAQAAKGSAVTITVAGGQSQVTVPSVVGSQQSQATNALIQARLQLGKVTQVASSQPAGVVVAQSPSAGSTVPVNTKVDLQVSTGQTAVPNVVGQSEAVATATLTNAGFQVTTQTTASAPPGAQAGTVVSQNPAAGAGLAANGTVVITVYTPATPTESPSPTSS